MDKLCVRARFGKNMFVSRIATWKILKLKHSCFAGCQSFIDFSQLRFPLSTEDELESKEMTLLNWSLGNLLDLSPTLMCLSSNNHGKKLGNLKSSQQKKVSLGCLFC